jgi:hypothetical protein
MTEPHERWGAEKPDGNQGVKYEASERRCRHERPDGIPPDVMGQVPVTGGFFEFDDAADDDPVRQRLVAMEAGWRAFLSGLTAAAVEAGELRKGLDVDQFVWELCGIYLSHHVSYRFAHDPLATKRAHTAFAELVNRSRAHSVAKRVSPPRTRRPASTKV